VFTAPGQQLISIPITIVDDDATDFVLTAETDNAEVTISGPIHVDGDTYEVTIEAPAGLDGQVVFTVSAIEAGYSGNPNIVPAVQTFTISTDLGFATPLAGSYVISQDGFGLTLGIDGISPNGEPLTLSAFSSTSKLKVYIPTGNRYALLHFADSDGAPIGGILVQLFDQRSATAVERFVNLSTLHVNETIDQQNGKSIYELIDAGAGQEPFYTDVPIFGIAADQAFLTGDPVNGDGSGDSSLGAFVPDRPIPAGTSGNLAFSSAGTLAYLNEDNQIFVTETSVPGLNGGYVIFGQVISGWDVYGDIMARPTNAQGVPEDTLLLQSVEILDSPADGTLTLVANRKFTGDGTVTVTLTDESGNSVSQDITIVAEDQIGQPTSVNCAADVDIAPGDAADFPVDVAYAGTGELDVSATSDYAGEGHVSLSITAVETSARAERSYILHVGLPASYDGKEFTITVSASLAGVGNSAAVTRQLQVAFGTRPTISDPGIIDLEVGGSITLDPLTITDPDNPFAELDLTITTDFDDDDDDDDEVSLDPNTYEVTINAPAGFEGIYSVTVTAVEAVYASAYANLAPGSQTFYVSTLGDRPVIDDQTDIRFMAPDESPVIQIPINDDSTVGFDVTVTDTHRLAEAQITDAGDGLYELIINSRYGNFFGTFDVTVSAIETTDLAAEVLTPTTYIFTVVCQGPDVPAVLDRISLDNAVVVATDGNWLYVGLGTEGLQVYDLTEPANPQLRGSFGSEEGFVGYTNDI
ncbi:MAG: peptidylprolyl isomerase, partial [Planctomycetes bacterium]|nr:peptidylprolyl isomerase [Planctomycetota bacterium]